MGRRRDGQEEGDVTLDKLQPSPSSALHPDDLDLLFIELKYAAADLRRISPKAAHLLDIAADEIDRSNRSNAESGSDSE